MIEAIGYILAIIIGLSLGLIGSGGSILTVPLLVYFFGLDAVMATAYSLFIVGISSGVGAVRFIIRKEADLRTAVLFAVPALVAVYTVRRYLMPALPEILFSVNGFEVSRDTFILLFFALIMLWAAVKMIRPQTAQTPSPKPRSYNYGIILLEGAIVGGVTGFVGAGGGFLIIPALVLLVGMPMKKAVATSLLIITVKSLLGFIGDVQTQAIDWQLLITLSLMASGGIYAGMALGKKIDGSQLKRGFGYFVLFMALFMLVKETGFL